MSNENRKTGSRKICVVGDFLKSRHKEEIENAAEKWGFSVNFYNTPEDATADAGDAEIIYTKEPELIAKAVNANWVADSNAGVDPVLKAGVLPDGALFTKGAGSYGVAISEHVVGVIIMLLKRFPEYYEHISKHEWFQGLKIRSIYESHITIVGTGDIGRNTARRLRGFDPASITGLNHSGRKTSDDFDTVMTSDKIDSVLPDTDILILCAPATPETDHLVGRKQLEELPEHALLISVGRGNVLDQSALIDSLNNGKIAGASLDVFEKEPLNADDPIWNAKNIIITPHISGQMTLEHTTDENIHIFCDNIKRYANGETLKDLVDLKKGY